jgi:hypothetical protein
MGKVRKGYLIDINPFCRGLVRKVLVDEYSVFIPDYGWVGKSFIESSYKLRVLPKEIEYVDWPWEDWWEKNWQIDAWGWCYMQKCPEFTACHVNSEGAVFAN